MPKIPQFISPGSADKIIKQKIPRPKFELKTIIDSAGYILAEKIIADRDSPPFDRVMMDGIAINSRSLKQIFKYQETQKAGQPKLKLKSPNFCIKIFTGAPIPNGCDCVIPIENINFDKKGNFKLLQSAKNIKGSYIHKRGKDSKKGEVLCTKGEKLTSTHIITAASVGKNKIQVYKHPRISIISTGDELIEPSKKPEYSQIRISNSYGIVSALKLKGFENLKLIHVVDNKKKIKSAIRNALKSDVLILTGGVSMGDTDLVPEVLSEMGASIHFHKVRQRPGKPFLFSTRPAMKKGQNPLLIFGLPGNPISSLICFYRYVLPCLKFMSGDTNKHTEVFMKTNFLKKHNLTGFIPIKTKTSPTGIFAFPVKTSCSGDYISIMKSEGFIEIPAKKILLKKGNKVKFFSW